MTTSPARLRFYRKTDYLWVFLLTFVIFLFRAPALTLTYLVVALINASLIAIVGGTLTNLLFRLRR